MGAKFKKLKSKGINRSVFLPAILIIGTTLMVASVFYLKFVFEKEISDLRKELLIISLNQEKNDSQALSIVSEPTSPETFIRLRELGVERYFLSEVKLIEARYTPVINTCLIEDNKPLYPPYVYETRSTVYYPEERPDTALVRYLLLPEDNPDFQPDTACYIKEIEAEADWQEVEERYGFSRRQFPARTQN